MKHLSAHSAFENQKQVTFIYDLDENFADRSNMIANTRCNIQAFVVKNIPYPKVVARQQRFSYRSEM